MSEDQENVAPMSRLPRLASPAKPSSSSIPTLTAIPPGPLLPSSIANKRKTASSPIGPPPTKRSVSGGALGVSTSGVKKQPSTGFIPTAAGKPAVGGVSRPGSSLAASTTRRTASTDSAGSASSSTSIGTARNRSATTAGAGGVGGRRPPVSASAGASSTRVGSGLSRNTMTSGARATSRGVSPGLAANNGRTAIGAGMASAAQFKSHDGRIENVEKMVGGFKELLEREQAKISSLQMSQVDLQTLLQSTQNTEREARRDLSSASEELAALRSSHAREVDDLERTIARKDREKRGLEEELRDSRDELSRERETVRELKQTLAQQSTQHLTLSAQLAASQTQLTMLQAEVERATLSVSSMKAELHMAQDRAKAAEDRAEEIIKRAKMDADQRIAEIEEELRAAETIRRKLHNQVQELKGNIRVFARVRPALAHESGDPEALADIAYGDERLAQETGQSQIVVTSRTESATGQQREQINNFTFDKIFAPNAGQKEVFEEISMLAQSVLDGYNVCIFAYGQTGSGKSWTMEGGQNDQDAGMIPRAIEMIFAVSNGLRDRGWKYQMEGQFLEVYNEVINDLLGNGQFDTKKHEIKFDKDGKVTVTDAVSIPLSNPRQVSTLLERARSRRAVAATLMNERSSRSHSVFTLKVRGENPLTNERCEASLNLVDLAGSERLEKSGAGENKDRLKETININKSLSALADVIGALGQGREGGHVPYRNSTLTRLLQTSLSGSSKTLMMCNLSPLSAHLGETLCSLRFATKVNTTQVGQVKKAGSK
ncbi:kinesin family member C1 [Kwoniella heveanensis BCC8398]|uniref:Kinesin-like protein n=1 Tax=Kwoniella heveanensis BCC8398 TaxID=1296120 RepID=A0A1B9GWZ6_9TREE|nr:kinesin family member C1 [Kwoniella heveanensis BCC8398]